MPDTNQDSTLAPSKEPSNHDVQEKFTADGGATVESMLEDVDKADADPKEAGVGSLNNKGVPFRLKK